MKPLPFAWIKKYFLFFALPLLVSSKSFATPQQVSIKIESFSHARQEVAKTQALFWSAQGNAKNKSVLLVPMLGKSKEDWSAFAPTLSQQGFDVLAIDLRYKGKGGQIRLIEDIQSSVVYLRTRPDLEKQKVVLVGASIGANGVATYAASTKQMHLLIDSSILISPGETYQDIGFIEALRKTAVIPTLLVAAEDDSYSTESVKKATKACSAFCKEHLFSDGGHGTQLFQSKHKQQLENLIVSFIEEHK